MALRAFEEHQFQEIKETAPLGPKVLLPQKATQGRLGVKADQSNMQKI